MDKLIIEGGVPLTGVVHVSGSKNAALPILMGSILLDEPVTYTNVPDLRDIRTTFKLLELLGCPNAFENGQVTVTPGCCPRLRMIWCAPCAPRCSCSARCWPGSAKPA